MNIFGEEYVFTTPISEEDVRQMKVGDIAYINGEIWSARALVLKRFVEDHEPLPIDTSRLNVFLTGGEGLLPADEKHTLWDPIHIGATTGLRYEKWIPGLIKEAGLRAIVCKGNMRQSTREACVKFGCLQLTPFGWPVTPHFNDVLKGKVKDEEIYWREGGLSEALVVYHVGNTGPWVVNIDTRGNVMYDEIYRGVDSRLQEVYKRINLPEDFEYTWKEP